METPSKYISDITNRTLCMLESRNATIFWVEIFMNPILWPDMMFEILNKTYLIGFYYLFPQFDLYCFFFPRSI